MEGRIDGQTGPPVFRFMLFPPDVQNCCLSFHFAVLLQGIRKYLSDKCLYMFLGSLGRRIGCRKPLPKTDKIIRERKQNYILVVGGSQTHDLKYGAVKYSRLSPSDRTGLVNRTHVTNFEWRGQCLRFLSYLHFEVR